MGYKLYHRRGERFFHIDEIDAFDDAEAMRLAQPLRGAVACELWQGRRRVSAYAPLIDVVAGTASAAR